MWTYWDQSKKPSFATLTLPETDKMDALRHNVATSLRLDVFFHLVPSAYTMSMSGPNLKQIGWKTRPRWPKNCQNAFLYIKASRPCYVMTFFSHVAMCLYHVSTKYGRNMEQIGRNKRPQWPKQYLFISVFPVYLACLTEEQFIPALEVPLLSC